MIITTHVKSYKTPAVNTALAIEYHYRSHSNTSVYTLHHINAAIYGIWSQGSYHMVNYNNTTCNIP